jgi:hypothetical protein
MKPRSILFFFALSCIILSSCREKISNGAEESYMLWSGEKPGKQVLAIHGKYRQSQHFTKEYIVYLELAPSQLWKNGFIKQNHLTKASDVSTLPADAPAWFVVPRNAKIWKQESGGNSLYIEDPQTGRFLIYEEQL